jgi:hypothetical protein
MNHYYIRDTRRVTPRLRALLEATYPGLSRDRGHWMLIQHILFSTHIDNETGRIIVNSDMLREMYNASSHRKATIKLLEQFEVDTGLCLNISTYSFSQGWARTIDPNIDPEILKEADYCRECRLAERTVYLVSGEAVSVRKERERIQKAKKEMLEEAKVEDGHPSKPVLDYLNNQPDRSLRSRVLDNLPNTRDFVNRTYKDLTRDYNRNLLMNIEEMDGGAHIYHLAERSPRVFPSGPSALSLSRDARKQAMKGPGVYDVDLKNAQLAIAAKKLDLPKLTAFLKTGASFWTEMLDHMSLESTEDNKQLIKNAVYATLYGMLVQNLFMKRFNWNSELYNAFISHPLIVEILEARDTYFEHIREQGGDYDAFGCWIANADAEGQIDPKSVAAAVMQSYEMQILQQIVPIAKRDAQISVEAWQHDGCTLRFGNKTKEESQLNNIKKIVDDYAVGQGFQTWLEIEPLS